MLRVSALTVAAIVAYDGYYHIAYLLLYGAVFSHLWINTYEKYGTKSRYCIAAFSWTVMAYLFCTTIYGVYFHFDWSQIGF